MLSFINTNLHLNQDKKLEPIFLKEEAFNIKFGNTFSMGMTCIGILVYWFWCSGDMSEVSNDFVLNIYMPLNCRLNYLTL